MQSNAPPKKIARSGAISTDAALVHGILNQDLYAFSELMRKYEGPLYRFILRYVGSPTEAEDLLQDTFTKIYTKASSYDPAWKVSTWVYRIALNTCRDYGRKLRLRRHLSIDRKDVREDSEQYIHEVVDYGPDVEHLTIHRENFRRVTEAIRQLPHNLQSALILFTIEGRSQAECSEILGISRKNVEMRVYRARKKLRAMIDVEL